MGHADGKKIGWVVLLNLAVTIAEYAGGVMSGSLALIADASHNLTDVTSLILGYAGEWLSEAKPSRKHSFGFKRIEVLTALINAILLWAVSIYIVYEAFERVGKPQDISIWLMIGIGFVGLVGNLFSVLVLKDEKDASLNMKAAYLHLFYDTISSVAVIFTGVVIYFTQLYYLDLIVSVFISVLIFASGIDIVKKAMHIFMQGVPEDIDIGDVRKEILAIKGIETIHNLYIWSVNSKETFLSSHVVLSPKIQANSEAVMERINEMLEKKFRITHTVIQLERDACKKGEGYKNDKTTQKA